MLPVTTTEFKVKKKCNTKLFGTKTLGTVSEIHSREV